MAEGKNTIGTASPDQAADIRADRVSRGETSDQNRFRRDAARRFGDWEIQDWYDFRKWEGRLALINIQRLNGGMNDSVVANTRRLAESLGILHADAQAGAAVFVPETATAWQRAQVEAIALMLEHQVPRTIGGSLYYGEDTIIIPTDPKRRAEHFHDGIKRATSNVLQAFDRGYTPQRLGFVGLTLDGTYPPQLEETGAVSLKRLGSEPGDYRWKAVPVQPEADA